MIYVRTSSYAIERLVNEVPPVITASFTASASSGEVPLSVEFAGLGDSSDSDDALSYTWDFGDGSSSDLSDPTHLFSEVGEFTVRLTVSNSRGHSDWYEQTIRVNEAQPDLFASGVIDCLFDWGEDGYPWVLRPARQRTEWFEPYHYRHYPETRSHIGVSTEDRRLYFLSSAGLVDLGEADEWAERAGCR